MLPPATHSITRPRCVLQAHQQQQEQEERLLQGVLKANKVCLGMSPPATYTVASPKCVLQAHQRQQHQHEESSVWVNWFGRVGVFKQYVCPASASKR
jgi:hypothetical protein